jgi:hypothetical protein
MKSGTQESVSVMCHHKNLLFIIWGRRTLQARIEAFKVLNSNYFYSNLEMKNHTSEMEGCLESTCHNVDESAE